MPDYQGRKVKYCTPTCKFLKCQQKALGHKFKNNNKLVVACNFAPGALCESYKCKYSFCVKYKMATDGKCMLSPASQKKQQKDFKDDEIDKDIKVKKQLKIKSKILKKLQDYDF